MADTITRYITMLSLIPGRPGKITARELQAKLQAQGLGSHVRSTERDLHKLSNSFPLISDGARPAGWSWQSKSDRITFPRMDAGVALTYELLARYLTPVLPREMCRHLEPEFAMARRVLDGLGQSPLGKWSRHISVLPSAMQLLPPDVAEEVIDVVYDALLAGNKFEADYYSAMAKGPKRYLFSPLGLVYRAGVIYLVATLWDYDEPRHFALQRMSKPKALDERAAKPEGFDFAQYVRDEKAFEYRVGPIVRLELLVAPWLARHLQECRLSEDQKIGAEHGSDQRRVTATVDNTEQLFWWLSSHGANVEVVKPLSIRNRMAEQANALAARYCQ
jgi:predicted DNA-binding transcriptional regulator YafY